MSILFHRFLIKFYSRSILLEREGRARRSSGGEAAPADGPVDFWGLCVQNGAINAVVMCFSLFAIMSQIAVSSRTVPLVSEIAVSFRSQSYGIAPPDPMDIGARLQELARLEDGWLDGEGKALPQDGLQWLTESFHLYFPSELKPPYLGPTEDGGISAEWPCDSDYLSLEIDLTDHQGHWHALSLVDDSYTETDIDLDRPDSWKWLCEQIQSKGGIT